MKCQIRKNVTSNALYTSDIECITEGLDLLEQDINLFLSQKDFSQISEENANRNLRDIASVRKQLEGARQSLDPNELKVVWIGLNFLRDDLKAPAAQRSEKNRALSEKEVMQKELDVRAARQKITAVFTRMGIDIEATLRGF